MNVKQTDGRQHGAAIVETAFTLLLFLVTIFGIMEAGWLLQVQQTLNNAAREGAKLAVLPQKGTIQGPTRGQVKNEVNRFIEAASISGATISINGQTSGSDTDVVGFTDLPPVDKNGTSCPWNGTAFVCNGSTSEPQFTKVQVTVLYQLITTSVFSMLQVNLSGEASMRNETSP